ncbi:MAG: HupE/UreJ family protein [Alphaproteobacteria bacterium]|nr:MAG: HupE/UreJ family protein [Alphaproteobacteria bacterium]
MLLRPVAAPAILIALTSTAFAHTGPGDASGLAHGFMHPIGALDHVLAMVAVGLYAATLRGRALWLVPAAFLGAMVLGGAAGVAGVPLPYVEVAIALSVVLLGLAVGLRVGFPMAVAATLAALFAVFHGHAHGAEMPPDVPGYAYAAGFTLATALLHGAGIALGLLAGTFGERSGWRFAQAAGGAMALAGIAMLAGVA